MYDAIIGGARCAGSSMAMLLIESPHRFAPLPSFYTLHVWAWKESPTGAFVNWHRNVSCEAFNPQQ
jgi:hypothetical protein